MPWFRRGKKSLPLVTTEELCKSNFHDKRWRALTNPAVVEKTLDAYATLKLRLRFNKAHSGPGLPQHWNGRKIEVELHKNDTKEDSRFVKFGEEWCKEIQIYSPLSIVRVSVKHEGKLEGFVEVFVADLMPTLNYDSEVEGCFQLSYAEELLGRADHRFEKVNNPTRFDFERPVGNLNAPAHMYACRRRHRGGTDAHVHMRLALKVHGELSDEWFAFCLPPPTFINFKTSTGQLNVDEFYMHIMDFLQLFWGDSLRPLITACQYVMLWRSIWLSSVLLAWWTITSIWTWMWTPSLPLFFLIWMILLRHPLWRKEVLAHQSSASLDDAGFSLVAAFYETTRMATWIERVIREEMTPPGEVNDYGKLLEFANTVWAPRRARESVLGRFRRPKQMLTFCQLKETLKVQDWIKWQPQQASTNSEPWWTRWVPTSYLSSRVRTNLMSYSDMLDDGVIGLRKFHEALDKLFPLYKFDSRLGCMMGWSMRFPGISQIKIELLCIACSCSLFFVWRELANHPVHLDGTTPQGNISFFHGQLTQLRGMRLIFGTGVMLYFLPPVQIVLRYFKANSRLREARRRQQHGGVRTWAFFQAEAEPIFGTL